MQERGAHRVVVACSALQELWDWMATHPRALHPRLVLLDLRLGPGLIDVADVERLVQQGLRVLIVSGTRDAALLQALLRAGASGFVAKEDSARELLAAIEAAVTGNTWTSRELAEIVARDPARPALSERELEAVTLYAGGLTMASVARQMGVGYDTARQYVERARRKWADVGRDARTKTDLYVVAQEDGLLGPDR